MLTNIAFASKGLWWFSSVYLIFAYGLWFLFPRFIQIRFSKIPRIKFVSFAYQIFYFCFLVLSFFIPVQLDIFFYSGLIIYLIGLVIYISAIYYFAINEIDKPVTTGIYRFLKHPVYFGFSLILFGSSVAGKSILLFVVSLVISILSYIVAKHEEKDCIAMYGINYQNYIGTYKDL